MKTRYLSEYRINKNGCECYRTRYLEEAVAKLEQLQAKRPGVYTMQTRSVQLNRYSVVDVDWRGEPRWSSWR